MIQHTLQAFQREFNPVLEQVLDRELLRYNARTSDALLLDALQQVKKIALSGGKRLRPYLVYLGYRAAGGDESSYRPEIGVAIELFHLFGLIHDDIIDRGATRHGVVTVHEYIRERLERETSQGDHAHIANGQALLVGDIVFAWVTGMMGRAAAEYGEPGRAAQEYFYRMVDDVLIGQMIDVDVTVRARTTRERIDEKMRLKTASYTFVRPLQIGVALSARSTDAMMHFCEKFGENLGLAFQIQDDLFDIIADPAVIHKPTMGDLRDRNHTVFTQYIREHGTDRDREQLDQLSGRILTPSDVKSAQALFRDSGAIAHGTQLFDQYFNQASLLVADAPFDSDSTDTLRELVTLIRTRTA